MQATSQILDDLRSHTSLDELAAAAAAHNMTPGWINRPQATGRKKVQSAFAPAHWRYAEAKAALQAAGCLIGTDLAERRNLVMRNPAAGSEAATLRTLICAYQSILPGEKAPSHRHASHALRVILESCGSYSTVQGEKTPMESGDIVLTPGSCWHGHGHDGADQAYWFDGLDVPFTRFLETTYYEEHPNGWENVLTVTDNSPMRFVWTETLEALARASEDNVANFGTTIELPAPTMPTIALKVHKWPEGWHNRPYRHTANTVFLVMQGSGRSTIGESTFDWCFGDTIAAPAWCRISHKAATDAIMFSMSDENLMRWTKYYRLEAA